MIGTRIEQHTELVKYIPKLDNQVFCLLNMERSYDKGGKA